MAIYKQNWFKYAKNLVIGVGASVVMIGALFKILSLEGGDQMLTAGLVTEAFLFLLLGLIPPDKDYYWEKLTDGGSEIQCGWLTDKFGVTWQVVPSILPELMSDPENAKKVTAAFMPMKKLDIEILKKSVE